ncbi:hypothetical protein ACTFIY_010019 [Dictyostelium cf. discoideum]
MHLQAYTSVKFEVVPSSNSKSIKVEYAFEINEEDREKIATTLTKLGALINNETNNLIGLQPPKREYFPDFNGNNIERFPKVDQEIKPISFENDPLPIISSHEDIAGYNSATEQLQ